MTIALANVFQILSLGKTQFEKIYSLQICIYSLKTRLFAFLFCKILFKSVVYLYNLYFYRLDGFGFWVLSSDAPNSKPETQNSKPSFSLQIFNFSLW
jgi:hypothetical protein